METTATGQEAYIIQQKKEWGEILTGFETKNKYSIMDMAGQQLMMAAEVGTGFLSRNFLKSARPWTIHVMTNDSQPLLLLKRPFKFYFHRVNVEDSNGAFIGHVQRTWSWVRRIYTVHDRAGAEKFTLFGPILHPWTFNILQNGQEIGKITKKWSGLAKEWFTTADNFGMTYPASLDSDSKDLLLAAVFLIDFVHFENKGN